MLANSNSLVLLTPNEAMRLWAIEIKNKVKLTTSGFDKYIETANSSATYLGILVVLNENRRMSENRKFNRLIFAVAIAMFLSACDTTDDDEPQQEPYIAQNSAIYCEAPSGTNPLSGCWELEDCYYNPKNYIVDPNDPSTDEAEDYWTKTIYSFSDDVQPYTVNSVQEYTEGRWMFNALYFSNSSCTGDPSFYFQGRLDEYYTRMNPTFMTTQGIEANVYRTILPVLTDGENSRLYQSYTIISSNRLCVGDSASNLINVGGEIEVRESLLLDPCFTRITELNQMWMTDVLPPWDTTIGLK